MRPSHAETDAAGFVLAGGRSSRMGRDKALVELGGHTLAARAVEILRRSGLSASIAGARSELDEIATVIADEAVDQGPLSGICTALSLAPVEYSVFLPVDLPLLPFSLIEYLLRHARTTERVVTLASVNGFAQTFPVVLRKSALPALQEELRAGRRGCFAAFDKAAVGCGQPVSVVAVELLAQAGQVRDERALPPAWWFLNVNTPSDMERARQGIA